MMIREHATPTIAPVVRDGHRAMGYMVGFVLLWAAIEALGARHLGRYSPYQVVWTRYGVHLTLMLLVWGRHDPARLWRTRRIGYQIARSMLMLGMPVSWIVSIELGVPPDTIMDVFWLSPLLILALSWMLLHERTHVPLWIATAVALCGAYLLHEPGHLEPLRLMAFPLAMAFCFSLYVVMTRSLRGEPVHVNLFYTALGVFVALTPAMPWLWTTPEPLDALIMAAIGVLGWLALWMLDRAAATAPVSVSAPFAYLQLAAFAAIAAMGGLTNDHSPRRMALGLLLIGGVAFYVWMRVQRLVEPGESNESTGISTPKES